MSLSILNAASKAPQQVALRHGRQFWTYRELGAEVEPYLAALDATTLQHTELQHADRSSPWVALVATSQPATLFALYALLEQRRPVVLLHPRWSEKERSERLHQSPTPVILDPIEKCLAPQTKYLVPREVQTKYLVPREEGDDVPLAMVFTSGSGGRPKGVVLSRRAFLASAAASAANLGWQDDDRWLLSMPIAHVGGLSIVTRCLAARRCLVLSEQDRFTAEGFAEEVERHRITLASLVPTMLHRLLAANPSWTPSPHLRAVLLGGAGAPAELLAEAADRSLPVLTTYGLTEACSQVTTQSYAALRRGVRNRGQLGAGPPLTGTELRIQDEEIQVRGPTLMEGYHPVGDGPSPFLEGGWFPTGDLGALDAAGNLHVHGRKGDRIITGGENVDPGEVEAALLLHPAIREACVFAVEDAEWGQRVCAALVCASPTTPRESELRAFLESRLAAYKLPRTITFVEGLPLLPSGKIDRRATARMVLQGTAANSKATPG